MQTGENLTTCNLDIEGPSFLSAEVKAMRVTGAELRDERLRSGVSGVALAGAIGVHPSVITRLEQAATVKPKSALRYREALVPLAAERARSQESVRAAAEALISAGTALIQTGRRLAGAPDV